jgi:hypothetical protein
MVPIPTTSTAQLIIDIKMSGGGSGIPLPFILGMAACCMAGGTYWNLRQRQRQIVEKQRQEAELLEKRSQKTGGLGRTGRGMLG